MKEQKEQEIAIEEECESFDLRSPSPFSKIRLHRIGYLINFSGTVRQSESNGSSGTGGQNASHGKVKIPGVTVEGIGRPLLNSIHFSEMPHVVGRPDRSFVSPLYPALCL